MGKKLFIQLTTQCLGFVSLEKRSKRKNKANTVERNLYKWNLKKSKDVLQLNYQVENPP